jgi:hypothetical protein
LCRRRSRRVHSRYTRCLGDFLWQGRIEHLKLQIRRFRWDLVSFPGRWE